MIPDPKLDAKLFVNVLVVIFISENPVVTMAPPETSLEQF